MDRYSVLWIDSARDDLYKIVEYIAAENEQTAHRIYNTAVPYILKPEIKLNFKAPA